MLCIASLIVFSILGIFSASHRELAREAFSCTIRRLTLRPCETGFKEKVKSKVLASLLERSVLAAKIFNKYFEILSFIFVVLMVGSTIWTIRGGYNYFFYGSCNGLNATGFCAFDASGENNKVTQVSASCGLDTPTEKDLDISKVNTKNFPVKNKNGKLKVVFIGCYECDYTRKAYPDIKKLSEKKDVEFVFMHYPAKQNTVQLSRIDYCAYQVDQEKFWQLNDLFFSADRSRLSEIDYLKSIINSAGYEADKILSCAENKETKTAVSEQVLEMEKSGLYGTPTVFIGNKVFVGPKPYRVYWWEIFKNLEFRM